ncbi:MAG: hypothetical protein OXI90_15725 [Gammaproteobacteria bacterium]|nr:hypothetical protein [Gammaproteobacteria bacterium]
MTYDRPTEPSGVLGVLTDGFLLYRASIRSIFLPVFVLALIVGEVSVNWQSDTGVRYWIQWLVSWVVTIYMYGFIVASVHFVASSDPSGIRSSLGIALRRLPTIVVVYFLLMLAIFAGSMLLSVPVVLLRLASFFFAILALAVSTALVGTALFASLLLPITEGYGPSDSLREGYSLVRRHWVKTFVVIAIAATVVTGLSSANYQVTWFLMNQIDNRLVANIVSMLTFAAFNAVITPLGPCLLYGAYQDLRLRQDGVAPA